MRDGRDGKRRSRRFERTLKQFQNLALWNSFGSGDCHQNGVQGSNAQGIVLRHRESMMDGSICLQDNVTANLMHAAIAEVFAQYLDQLGAAEIAWEFHATANTSSRTRCSLTAAGLGWSKK